MDDFDPRDQPRLSSGLRRLTQARMDVPPEIDRAVMNVARRRLGWWGPRVFTIRRAGGMVAAAACMALMVWLWNSSTPAVRHAANRVEHLALVPGDLDSSGRVDILDAYRLAKAIQSGDMPSRGDVNSDGAIDSADVEALAMLAVRLEGAG